MDFFPKLPLTLFDSHLRVPQGCGLSCSRTRKSRLPALSTLFVTLGKKIVSEVTPKVYCITVIDGALPGVSGRGPTFFKITGILPRVGEKRRTARAADPAIALPPAGPKYSNVGLANLTEGGRSGPSGVAQRGVHKSGLQAAELGDGAIAGGYESITLYNWDAIGASPYRAPTIFRPKQSK